MRALLITSFILVANLFFGFTQTETSVVIFENGKWKKGVAEFVKDSTEVKLKIVSGQIFYYPVDEIVAIKTVDEFIAEKRQEREKKKEKSEKQIREILHFIFETGGSLATGGNAKAIPIISQAEYLQLRGSKLLGFTGRLSVGGLVWKKRLFLGGGAGFHFYNFIDADVPAYLVFPIFINSQIYIGKKDNKFYISNLIGLENRFGSNDNTGENNFFYEGGFGFKKQLTKKPGQVKPDNINIGLTYHNTVFTPTLFELPFTQERQTYHQIGIRLGIGF